MSHEFIEVVEPVFIVGICISSNGYCELSLREPMLELDNQMILDHVKPRPHVFNRFPFDTKRMLFFFQQRFVRKYPLSIQHHVPFLPSPQKLRLLVYLPKYETLQHYLLNHMRLLLPFCLLESVLKR